MSRLKQRYWPLSLISLRASTYFRLLILSQHDPFDLADLSIGIFITSAFVLFHFLFSMLASDMSGYTVLCSTLLLIYCPFILGASCYYPDQSIPAVPYIPCSGTATGVHNACCASGDQCTEKGFCFGSAGYVYRGGCTDITWQSPNCAQQCRDGTQS